MSTITQNFIQIGLGVSVLRMRDSRPSAQSDSAIFFIPANAKDYVFTGVGLSVCLSVCLFVTTITK